jgi:hypothetical protein
MKWTALVVLVSLLTLTGCGPGGPLSFISPEPLPTVVSFEATPLTINEGGSSTLTWEVSGATTVKIDGGVGSVALTGSRLVTPITTTLYTLVAANADGKSISATTQVTVTATPALPASPPVIQSFVAEPSDIDSGDASILSWEVTDATSVTINQGVGSVALSGSSSVSPEHDTDYTLTATNSAGSVHEVVSVSVDETAPPADEDEEEGEEEYPDLVVTGISKVVDSDHYIIAYTIENQGEGSCPSTVAKLYVNGVYKASDTVPSLNPGEDVDGEFSSWTYVPTTPVVKVVADAGDDADEDDENNNEKQVSIAVETIVNYVDKANLANWVTGPPGAVISFGGSTGDSNGFAVHQTNVKLEDGDTHAKVLETHPKWVSSGWIIGYYPTITVPIGARFVAEVGFMNGAAATDGVVFKVFFAGDGPAQLLEDVEASCDGDLDSFNIDLEDFVGESGQIILEALAGSSSAQDWAVWVNAKMIR